MGPVREVPFVGQEMNEWFFPICLVVMVVLTLMDVYSICLRCFTKRAVFIRGNSTTIEKVSEGKYIIDKFKQDKNINYGQTLLENEYGLNK